MPKNSTRYAKNAPLLSAVKPAPPSLPGGPERAASKPFGSYVHYDAFFCRMERHTLARTGVWVKIHAGDYDRYTRGSAAQSP